MLLDVLTIDLQRGPTGLKDQTIAGMSMAMTSCVSMDFLLVGKFAVVVSLCA